MPLHDTLEALADGGAGDVHKLAAHAGTGSSVQELPEARQRLRENDVRDVRGEGFDERHGHGGAFAVAQQTVSGAVSVSRALFFLLSYYFIY